MLVPVVVVTCVPVAVVEVVDVVAVFDRLVAAVGSVLVVVVVVHGMERHRVALVPMIAVGVMGMAIVEVVDVSLVIHGDVAAVGSVEVGMLGVGGVVGDGHGGLLVWSGGSGDVRVLGRMQDRVGGDMGHVVVGEAVRHLTTSSGPADESGTAKHAEVLGHQGLRDARGSDELVYATLTLRELGDDGQADRVPEGTKESGGLLQGLQSC